ncbi:hypothetical protein C1645_865815 [Glomus cerebriforme]|uniref:Uncharacterized protein n=1 Tax=Glomus cerebriforme TaxID=658196 RepID=A0A397SAH4_9GLOM|nr:hypothetical protein C1645_865815 [Glomus cerebriforme]
MRDPNYFKAWNNEKLTRRIIEKFKESNYFQKEEIEEPEIKELYIQENEEYQDILEMLRERELDITLEDIIRIIRVLGMSTEQIYNSKFIEVYNSQQHLEDDELGEILLEWIKRRQEEEIYEEIKSDDNSYTVEEDEENVIKTPSESPTPQQKV